MITSSKCRPRNSAGRRRVTVHRTRSAQAAFATEPALQPQTDVCSREHSCLVGSCALRRISAGPVRE